jgi:hypothetical protein
MPGQGDAVAAGDRGQPAVGLAVVGDGSDANRVPVPLVGRQPPVAPPAGLGGGGDEWLIPQIPEADLLALGKPVSDGQCHPAGLGQQHLGA